MDLNLRGNVAVITGGAAGIGLACAKTFAEEGCNIVLWDRSIDVSNFAARLADEHSIHALGITVDVTDERNVNKATARTIEQFSRIDHLVHCAAIGSSKYGFPYTNLSPSDWPLTLQVNIMGMVNVAHAVGPILRDAGSGSMLFVASVAGQIGSQTDPPYSASKAANINFAQCMAKDLAPHGVRVNTVCPGMVQTTLNRSVWQAWYDQTPAPERLSYEEWTDRKIRSVVPLGCWQTAEDVASLIVFLSSTRAQHITGQTMNVDGGFVMHW